MLSADNESLGTCQNERLHDDLLTQFSVVQSQQKEAKLNRKNELPFCDTREIKYDKGCRKKVPRITCET